MIHSASTIDHMPQTNTQSFITNAYLFLSQCVAYIAAICCGLDCLVAPLRHLWTHYYPRVAFGEEAVIMPHSTLTFIITVFLAFMEIKSQGEPEFPFQTHPRITMFSITSLLIYGLGSVAELVFSIADLDNTSVYVAISRLGMIGSLCILVASLASLFYL